MPVQRPGTVTAAAIVMIVLGALITLFGLIFVLGAAVIGGAASTGDLPAEAAGMEGMLGIFAGFVIGLAVILLALGILEIVAGAQVLSGKGWARVTGIVLAVILGLFSLLGMTGGDQGGNIIVSLVFVVANAFIVYALWTGGRWFAARSGAAA